MSCYRGRFKCDVCGEFIPASAFASGRAVHRLVTPDSEYSVETYETLCPKHRKEQP